MHKANERAKLWSDLSNTEVSAHITSNYRRVRDMAIAYKTCSSSLYHNSELKSDIISALDWLYFNRYNEIIPQYNNWWDWAIGVPLALNDITVLLYNDLTSAQITNYMNVVDHFEPEVTRTGANRVWDCTVIAVRGVIVKDTKKIASARDGLSR